MEEAKSLLSKSAMLQEIRKDHRLYSFDKALRSTINKRYRTYPEDFGCFDRARLWLTRGAWFQVVYIIMNCIQASLGTFTQSGMALLEKEPPRFECLEDGEWQECTKEEICGSNMPRDHYRYDED